MENTYAIIWLAKSRGKFAVGTKRFSREAAENLAAELNESHEGILHRAFDTAQESPAEALSALQDLAAASTEPQNVSYPDFVAAQAAAVVPKPLMPQPKENVVSLTASLPEVLTAAGE